MIHCTNCGQINTETSYFCRFCGAKFSQPQPANPENYEYAPPRPYSWKTDEYQVAETKKARISPTKQAQPIQNPYLTQQSARPQPLVHQNQQQQNIAYGYRCPRCASQTPPILSKRISAAGWIVFAVLLVMSMGILCWIGLLFKEDVRVCPVCNLKIN